MSGIERFLCGLKFSILGVFIAIPIIIVCSQISSTLGAFEIMSLSCISSFILGYFFPNLVLKLFEWSMNFLSRW